MSIFDLFTFKKDAEKVLTKENFVAVMKRAREEIIKQVKNNIPGPEKKRIVDNIVILKVREAKEGCKNKVVLWVIDKIILVIPAVTQLIYDFLKEKVENL